MHLLIDWWQIASSYILSMVLLSLWGGFFLPLIDFWLSDQYHSSSLINALHFLDNVPGILFIISMFIWPLLVFYSTLIVKGRPTLRNFIGSLLVSLALFLFILSTIHIWFFEVFVRMACFAEYVYVDEVFRSFSSCFYGPLFKLKEIFIFPWIDWFI